MSTPASLINNVWLLTCKGCGAYDVVGPGHPAVRPQEGSPGVVEIYDRSAVRHSHAAECEHKDKNGDGPMDFSFMPSPAAFAPAPLQAASPPPQPVNESGPAAADPYQAGTETA